MSACVRLALPSKGRLKEQTEAWLSDCGFTLALEGGARAYQARLVELPATEILLLSASDIATALDHGEVHLGVTGEDVIRERGAGVLGRVAALKGLGFGRADLVVAAPKSWIDVERMSDLEEVAHLFLGRTGRRLRVATKYGVQTRAFFAARGIENYRIVDSAGATEGAPAAGAAELVVDITTTGATLAANNLKVVSDGVILRSEAKLAASLAAPWSEPAFAEARRLVSVVEARSRARTSVALSWPETSREAAEGVLPELVARGAARCGEALLLPRPALFEASELLAAAGVGPLTVSRPHYVFEPTCETLEALKAQVAGAASPGAVP